MTDYENITLEELDTSRFFNNPKSVSFAQQLKRKNKAFIIDIEAGLPEGRVLKYIALMYDPASELRNNVQHLPSRKRICAKVAGFEMEDRKFSPSVEKMLTGGYKKVNEAIVAYCFLTFNIYFVAHAAYQDMYFRAIKESFEGYDKESIRNLQDLQSRLISNEKAILGGDESGEMIKALYKATSRIDLGINPESIVKKLEAGEDLDEMNPYEAGYKPSKIRYAGAELPK